MVQMVYFQVFLAHDRMKNAQARLRMDAAQHIP